MHFDHLGRDWKWGLLLIFSLIFILAGSFMWVEFGNPAVNSWLTITGFFIQIVFLSKLFWRRNVVQWNNKGVVIRLKPFFGKSLRFTDIESTQMIDQFLTIKTRSGKELHIDLSDFPDSDSN